MVRNLELFNTPVYSLYHYTNMEALINILKTNTLWATDCKYLNDLSETKTMDNIYNELLETDNKDLNDYITEIKERGDPEGVDNKKQTYFISFTTEKDSIALWNYFGENGVALEFDVTGILYNDGGDEITVIDKNNESIPVSSEIIYGKIKYDDCEIKKLYHEFFDPKATDPNNDINENHIEIIRTSLKLNNIIYFKKNNGFSYESEYRIVININKKDATNIEHFRVKNGLIIPYIAICFGYNLFSLKSITINPKQSDCMIEEGIKRLLIANNYNIPIHRSDSKIRW
jgi:uncharacterized protein (UPF0248 family)